MPFVRLQLRIRRAARRISAKVSGAIAAVKNAFLAAVDGIIGGVNWLGRACWSLLTAFGNFARACARWGIGMVIRALLFLAAYISRFWPWILVVVFALGISEASWKYWPPAPSPTHRHMVHRPPPPDVVHRVFPKDSAKDSRNGDFYYLVNILFVPLQTVLLLIGGLVALRTLNQSHKFKQHDVETNCVRDYIAIEKRLLEATGDRKKLEGAVRAYWMLMVYEYYWWRRGLLSRGLFTIWCEFRVQQFRKPPTYVTTPAPTGAELPLTHFSEGYEYCKSVNVFPSPSGFEDLMKFLIDRAGNRNIQKLKWRDIEYYRYRWDDEF
jgi:hypothetical protein